MIEFNPDGSIKVPEKIANKRAQDTQKMKTGRCIQIRKDVVNEYSPKKCALHITLSDAITDDRFIHTLYKEFSQKTEANTKLTKMGEKEYSVEVGTSFRRCSDCQNFVGELREFLYGNVVEEHGTCTRELNSTFQKNNNFAYEDYFE